MDAEFQKQGLTDLTETDLQAVVTPGRHSGYCRHWRGYCMFCEKTRGLLPLSSFIRRRYFLSFENTAGPYRIHNTPDKRNATSPYSLAINKSGRVWPGISPRTGKEAQKQKLKEADTHWSHSKWLLKNYTNYLVGQQVIHIYSHWSSNKILTTIPVRSKEDPDSSKGRVSTGPGGWSPKL